MTSIFSDTLKSLKAVDQADQVWDILSGFMKHFGVSSLVYRYSPTNDKCQYDQQIIIEKSYSATGNRNFEVINFSYEKEFAEPKLELRDLIVWKNTAILPMIYEKDSSLEGRFSVEEELKGIMFPVIADAGNRGVFILAFEDSKKVYEPDTFYHMSGVCERAHRALNYIAIDKLREKLQLSSREREVLAGVIDGRSNLDLAAQTGLSRHTIDGYLRRVFLKVGVKDRTSAAVVALKSNLVSRPSYCLRIQQVAKKYRRTKINQRVFKIHSRCN